MDQSQKRDGGTSVYQGKSCTADFSYATAYPYESSPRVKFYQPDTITIGISLEILIRQEITMERSIGVDVDLTIVDTLTEWTEWWEAKTGKEFPWHKIGSDFSINDALKEHMDADAILEFWKQEDLYDNLEPIYGVFQTLSLLSTGYDIYFLSYCQPEHFESKKRFLDRYFPFPLWSDKHYKEISN